MFRESFKRMFMRDKDGHLVMGFGATMEVQTTQKVKVSGAIGPIASLGRKGTRLVG